ncbi:MAG: preprotein translocase subunit SecG [Actinobacteria bacterium HGW-Actinobacteria-9]|nr:MAG: preprotein translocase subunit SecG [Actinobacteria bacterium HGW-Actinobacteria-9]
MNAFVAVVLVIHVLVSVGLVVFILLHSGKGTGVSSMFSGVMPTTASGTGIIEKNLDRITLVMVGVFTLTTLLLMIFYHPGA